MDQTTQPTTDSSSEVRPIRNQSNPIKHTHVALALLVIIILVVGSFLFFAPKSTSDLASNFTGNPNHKPQGNHPYPPYDQNETNQLNPSGTDQNTADNETNSETSTNSTSNITHAQTAFIAIHCEPGNDARTTNRPAVYWPDLVELVELADKYNIKLTLMFNPQWATYILEDESKLDLVRSWEANGHEIAAHHHGPSYGDNWDGYTNELGYDTNPEYLGNMTDYINLLNQLPTGGQIYSGGIAAAPDKPYDWPEGIIYSAEGIEMTELLSTPTKIEYNGYEATELTYSLFGFTAGRGTTQMEDLDSAYSTSTSDQYIGIVFHEKNYADAPENYDQLFQFLTDRGIEVKSLGGILKDMGY
jgi:hypothetical protein